MPTYMPVRKEWMTLTEASREYATVSRDVLIHAIRNHELDARVLPSVGRNQGKRANVRVSATDIDAYMRSLEPYDFT